MTPLREQLREARAKARALEQAIAANESCAINGHVWKSLGGCNCGCHPEAQCSVPVHECVICGDCDYGINPDATEARERCLYRDEYFASATGGSSDGR